MKTIKMNTIEIINSYGSYKGDQETLKIISCLFNAANDYENAQINVTRYIERMRKTLNDIEKGDSAPFYSISDLSFEMAQEITKRDAAKKLFETVAKISGFTVE